MDKIDEKVEVEKTLEDTTENSSQKKNVFSRLIDKHAKKKEQKRKELEETEASRSPEEKEEINEKIEEANKEAKKVNSKKQKIINICFLFLNIALVVAILLWNLFIIAHFFFFFLLCSKAFHQIFEKSHPAPLAFYCAVVELPSPMLPKNSGTSPKITVCPSSILVEILVFMEKPGMTAETSVSICR